MATPRRLTQYIPGSQFTIARTRNGIACSGHPSKIQIRLQFRGFGRLFKVLTESQVERSFRKLIKVEGLINETFEKAEELLEELRPESPLRHRLFSELDELREMTSSE